MYITYMYETHKYGALCTYKETHVGYMYVCMHACMYACLTSVLGAALPRLVVPLGVTAAEGGVLLGVPGKLGECSVV